MARERTRLEKVGADIGWAAIRVSESLIKCRGTGYALRFGMALGKALWPIGGRRRQLALRNARAALPALSEGERRRVVKTAVADSIAHWPELMSYAYFGTRRVLRTLAVEGAEHLDAALAKGRGVIAPSLHLGNFPLMGVWMTEAGYEFYFVQRTPHDQRVARRFAYLRKYRLGIGHIADLPRRACIEAIIRAMRRNAIVFMALDQRAAGGDGIEIPFFGRPFNAFPGPVALALRNGAALVPMFVVRERGIRNRLVIEPEFELERSGDRRADTEANLRRLMIHLEKRVRGRPDQWWWVSRIWKGV